MSSSPLARRFLLSTLACAVVACGAGPQEGLLALEADQAGMEEEGRDPGEHHDDGACRDEFVFPGEAENVANARVHGAGVSDFTLKVISKLMDWLWSLRSSEVSTMLENRCGSLDCHGSRLRNLRIYGYGGLRLPGSAADPLPEGYDTSEQELEANYDAVIECLPGCCGPDNPPRYEPVTSGQHRLAKFLRGVGAAAPAGRG